MLSEGRNRPSSERGVALLIAIFALILISGVAVSLIMMSGTESAINANYRRTTTAFYAAHAGIEEARERLVPCSPNSLWPATACANPPVSADPLLTDNPPTVVGQIRYILNPAPGDPGYSPQAGPAPYTDTEYASEFPGTAPPNNPGQTVASAPMTTAGGQPPLPYKWVRITLKNEQMVGLDLDGNGMLDTVLPVRVDGRGRQCLQGAPGCTSNPNAPVTTRPVYRVTSYAIEPSGSRRLVQAEVALMPIINPNGAIASQAGVSINGNFNAFGAWPPIVQGDCGTGKAKATKDTCGSFSGGAIQPDCNNLYDPGTDTCNGVPRSHNDYCNVGSAVDSVSSAGAINTGNYDEVPDSGTSCKTTGGGCIFTASPQQAVSPNQGNWPYDMDQIIDMLKPPITEPIQSVAPSVTCTTYDSFGNRSCSGQGVNLGTLPSPWPPLPNTQPTNNSPEVVYADVGKGGLLKLTGASSGSGILVVEGDLEVQAGFQWYGLIVVRGVVTFLGGGATSTNVVGGILAGTSVTNATTTTGGSVSVTYSSCAFRFNSQTLPLRYLSFREVTQ